MDPLLLWAVGWYSFLYRNPAWKDYAWQQCLQMRKDTPWLYHKLPELVQAKVARAQSSQG